MKTIFKIDRTIDQINLQYLAHHTTWHDNSIFFTLPPGREHYPLLAHLSAQCPKDSYVIDIGTYLGFSALALAHNPDIKVVSYDIVSDHQANLPKLPNIQYKVADCTTPHEMDLISQAPLVLLDVDPHDGIQERDIFTQLEVAGFRGILVLDDIHVNSAMKGFWDWIPNHYKKYDITHFGHFSGTGLVVFDDNTYDVIIN